MAFSWVIFTTIQRMQRYQLHGNSLARVGWCTGCAASFAGTLSIAASVGGRWFFGQGGIATWEGGEILHLAMPVLVFDLVVCAACNYAAPVMCLFLDEPSHHVRYTGTSIRQAASPGYGSICCWISSQPQCLYRTLWLECCVLYTSCFCFFFLVHSTRGIRKWLLCFCIVTTHV